MTETRTLYHRTDCSADPAKVRDFIGKQGDPMRGCIECRRFVVHPDKAATPKAPAEPIPAPEPEPEPERVLSPYRCRDHHDQPVTAKGKGCRRCRPHRRARSTAA